MCYIPTICHVQLGLEVKTKPAEELTETVEITEEVDEEAEIQGEVSSSLRDARSHLAQIIATARTPERRSCSPDQARAPAGK